jgi:DNA-binding transcriptional LysR family regulator
MKLEGLEAFVTVVETGSISAAARQLRLSKSVVSERLAELERRLGLKLVQRTTRRLSLTEDGSAFHERAVRIMREIESATADIAERRGTLAGPLRLSAPVTFGRMHLGPALFPFLARYPEIRLTLDLDDRRVDVAAGGYDAVLRHGPIVDTRLVVWRLAPSRRVLVASPDYLARSGTPRTKAELEACDGIFYANRGVADWSFVTADGSAIVRAKARFTANNGDMLRDAAIAGLGVALLPLFIAGEAIRAGTLRMIDLDLQAASEFIFIAHTEGRAASAKLRAMADHLRATFGDPPIWERGLPPTENSKRPQPRSARI